MDETNNSFEIKRQESQKTLEECQVSKALDSCLKCTELIGCTIRNQYVRSVYESMSKGSTGGFDF